MDWKDIVHWYFRIAAAGLLLLGILVGVAIGKIF